MDCGDLTFDDIRILLILLKHSSVRLSQGVEARLKGPSSPAMDHEMYIPTDDHESSSFISTITLSSAIYRFVHSGELPFQTVPSPQFLRHQLAWRDVAPIPPIVSEFSALVENFIATH